MPLRPGPTLQRAGLPLWLAAALALTVFGVRLWWLSRHGSNLPYWDQWDAEYDRLLGPWWRGEFDPAVLLSPHNEHRILFTRLIAVGLAAANGQWDPLLECVVNAALWSVLLAALAAALWRVLTGALERALLLVLVLLWGASTIGWENTLAGFQNQFYLLAAMSVGLLALAARWPLGRAFSAADGRAAAGLLLLALAAPFTMASGALGVLAAATVLGLRLLVHGLARRGGAGDQTPGTVLPAVLMLGVLLAIGLAALAAVPHIPGHQVLRPTRLADAWMAFAKAAGWPLGAWVGLLLWVAPAVLLLRALLPRQRPATDAWVWFAIGLSAFVMATALATAWSRGAGGPGPAARYHDVLALNGVLALLSVRLLVRDGVWRGRWLVPAMGVVLAGGLLRAAHIEWHDMAHRGAVYAVGASHAADYLRDGDTRRLAAQAPHTLPYPSAERLAQWLGQPELRAHLPPSLAPWPVNLAAPVPVTPGARNSCSDQPWARLEAAPLLQQRVRDCGAGDSAPAAVQDLGRPLLPGGQVRLAVAMTGPWRADAHATLVLRLTDGSVVRHPLLPGDDSAGEWHLLDVAWPAPGALQRAELHWPAQVAGQRLAVAGPAPLGRLRGAIDALLDLAPLLGALGVIGLLLGLRPALRPA